MVEHDMTLSPSILIKSSLNEKWSKVSDGEFRMT
jgi:hypothetical protein